MVCISHFIIVRIRINLFVVIGMFPSYHLLELPEHSNWLHTDGEKLITGNSHTHYRMISSGYSSVFWTRIYRRLLRSFSYQNYSHFSTFHLSSFKKTTLINKQVSFVTVNLHLRRFTDYWNIFDCHFKRRFRRYVCFNRVILESVTNIGCFLQTSC